MIQLEMENIKTENSAKLFKMKIIFFILQFDAITKE